MIIYSDVIGNIADEVWHEALPNAEVEYIVLDQWTAQKSRFVVRSTRGKEYAIALGRNTRLRDGDILAYYADEARLLVVRLDLGEVMEIDCSALLNTPSDEIFQTAVELGHALGNQHWPMVMKGGSVYVPLTVDRRVMRSVMQTHNIAHTELKFLPADEVIPYLAPNEIRRLFGGVEQSKHHHHHHSHDEHR